MSRPPMSLVLVAGLFLLVVAGRHGSLVQCQLQPPPPLPPQMVKPVALVGQPPMGMKPGFGPSPNMLGAAAAPPPPGSDEGEYA
jgi:hypothetical protein